jgi:hypothetical protein
MVLGVPNLLGVPDADGVGVGGGGVGVIGGGVGVIGGGVGVTGGGVGVTGRGVGLELEVLTKMTGFAFAF